MNYSNKCNWSRENWIHSCKKKFYYTLTRDSCKRISMDFIPHHYSNLDVRHWVHNLSLNHTNSPSMAQTQAWNLNKCTNNRQYKYMKTYLAVEKNGKMENQKKQNLQWVIHWHYIILFKKENNYSLVAFFVGENIQP